MRSMPILHTFESHGVADCVSGYTRAVTHLLVEDVESLQATPAADRAVITRRLAFRLSDLELDMSSRDIAQMPVMSWLVSLRVTLIEKGMIPKNNAGVAELEPKQVSDRMVSLEMEDVPRKLPTVLSTSITLNIFLRLADYRAGYLVEAVRREAPDLLNHEIHHLYEMYRIRAKGKSLPVDHALSDVLLRLRSEHPNLRKMTYPIYLGLDLEINARVSQAYQRLKNTEPLTQSTFFAALKKTPEYRDLNIMRSFCTADYMKVLNELSLTPEFYRFLGEFNEGIATNPVLLRKHGGLWTATRFFDHFAKLVNRRAVAYHHKLRQLYQRLLDDAAPIDPAKPIKPRLA